MKGYTIRTSDIQRISDCYNSVWNYCYLRYFLHNDTTVDVPYNCNCKPILHEFREGILINFEDLSSVVII